MNLAVFLKPFFSNLTRILVVLSVLGLAMPVLAGKQKTFNKNKDPTELVLTLPDQLLNVNKANESINELNSIITQSNSTQTSALKRTPVNVNCDVDVIQNTVIDLPLSSRLYGECGVNYHY